METNFREKLNNSNNVPDSTDEVIDNTLKHFEDRAEIIKDNVLATVADIDNTKAAISNSTERIKSFSEAIDEQLDLANVSDEKKKEHLQKAQRIQEYMQSAESEINKMEDNLVLLKKEQEVLVRAYFELQDKLELVSEALHNDEKLN